jgi:gamma-glutamyltranspeptidase/glutathione hydrolase
LLSKYNAERTPRLIGAATASMALRPGTVAGYTPVVDQDARARARVALRRHRRRGRANRRRLGVIGADTCHIDVIDKHGNMVSATPSGGWLQSSPVIPGLGFCMGTRGQMFWLRDPACRTRWSPASGRAPRCRQFRVARRQAWMAFGTPGGEQQDQWSLIMFLRMVHHGMNIQEAIDAPSFHTEHWPSSFWPRVARPGKVVIEGRYSTTACCATCAPAATTPAKATTGAKAGCPAPGLSRMGRCSPAPIRGGCKGYASKPAAAIRTTAAKPINVTATAAG